MQRTSHDVAEARAKASGEERDDPVLNILRQGKRGRDVACRLTDSSWRSLLTCPVATHSTILGLTFWVWQDKQKSLSERAQRWTVGQGPEHVHDGFPIKVVISVKLKMDRLGRQVFVLEFKKNLCECFMRPCGVS